MMWHRCKGEEVFLVNDIPAAFLHVDMKDTVHMVLQGTIV